MFDKHIIVTNHLIESTSKNNIENNITSYIAIIISFLSIIISIFNIYNTKKLEIKYDKFKKLCLNLIEAKFEEIYKFINDDKSKVLNLRYINDNFQDLNFIFIQIKEIYPKLDIDVLQNTTFNYTDKIFERSSKSENDYLIKDFLITKMEILNKLYDFALYEELGFLQRFILKI